MEIRVALSYAGEDCGFVEYVAAILERFLGEQSVFHYTAGENRQGIQAFFEFINNCLKKNSRENSRDVARTVCFVRKTEDGYRIVVGQQTELLDSDTGTISSGLRTWQAITNSREATALDLKTISVTLPSHGLSERKSKQWSVPFNLNCFGQVKTCCEVVMDIDRASAELVAEFILRDTLSLKPQIHSCKAFTYEKDIITFYAELLNLLRKKPFPQLDPETRARYEHMFNLGVPLVWPTVRLRTDLTFRPNALLEDGTIGSHRPGIRSLIARGALRDDSEAERLVVSAALSQHHSCTHLDHTPDACMIRSNLCFPEAGPRAQIMERPPTVGVVVSGGIAPGINAVIDGIVRRHEAYDSTARVYGFKYGLRALSQVAIRMPEDQILLSAGKTMPNTLCTAEHVSQGGSMLGTFRLDRLDYAGNESVLGHVMNSLEGLDVLYIIGGDGSMKAACLLAKAARERRIPVSIVGIPKTMDNDILWVWQSFGFSTAVEKAREIINCLSTEVQSNPRICVLQLFGSVSGFVVSHAVLSSHSGQCDVALIPEASFTIKALANKLLCKFMDHNGRVESTQLPLGMIVMAETAIPKDATDYESEAGLTGEEVAALQEYLNQDTYLDGQTSDELRSAGLKLVVHGLKKELTKHFEKVRIFSNEPRHILRATNPSFSDIIIGQRLGALAVDNAMAGYSDFMVSQWLTEFVLVPLRLVSLGRKRIPETGIFWKSVLAKTGQGDLSDRTEQAKQKKTRNKSDQKRLDGIDATSSL